MSFLDLQELFKLYFKMTNDHVHQEVNLERERTYKYFVYQTRAAILIFIVKATFYLILLFLFGYLNSTSEPRLKVAVIALLLIFCLLCLYLLKEFVFEFKENFEFIMVVFMGLNLIFYIITSCRNKGRLFSNFNDSKNEIYYDYTYQKMFGHFSKYWTKKQKKNFVDSLNKKETGISPNEIDERFKKYSKDTEPADFYKQGSFRKVGSMFS